MSGLAEIAVFTDDTAVSIGFYRRLLGASPDAEWPGGGIFATGGAKLLIHERSAAIPDGPPNEDHFAIAVEDLDSQCATLAAGGVSFLLGPRDYPWGRSAYLRDPDGRLVELAQA